MLIQTFKSYKKDFFAYVQFRAQTSRHPLLKARYHHILWEGPRGIKNKNNASGAIDQYIQLIQLYSTASEADRSDHWCVHVQRNWEHATSLCASIKERVNEVKQLTQTLLSHTPQFTFPFKNTLLGKMLEYATLFKREDFTQALSLYDSLLTTNLTDSEYFALAHYWLPTAVQIGKKLGQSPKKWYTATGECQLHWADSPTNQDPDRLWVKQQHYAQAIEAFRMAGNLPRKQYVEALYNTLKSDVRLATFTIEYPPELIPAIKEWDQEIQRATTHLLNEPAEIVYNYLAQGSFFTPIEKLKSARGMEPWAMLATKVQFDINKNIIASNTDKEDENLWLQYQFLIRHTVAPYAYHVFVPGIKAGKLTAGSFLTYLQQHTWLGQVHKIMDLGGHQVEHHWIPLLAPSIIEYFAQVRSALLSTTYTPNFILCIDSLVLKIEGLFRDFCTHLKIPTSTGVAGGVQEKMLHNILQDEMVLTHFSENDRLFFSYLFDSKQGLDMRNNIAHSFYHPIDYTIDRMHLTLLALLRIAKFRFQVSLED